MKYNTQSIVQSILQSPTKYMFNPEDMSPSRPAIAGLCHQYSCIGEGYFQQVAFAYLEEKERRARVSCNDMWLSSFQCEAFWKLRDWAAERGARITDVHDELIIMLFVYCGPASGYRDSMFEAFVDIFGISLELAFEMNAKHP